MESDIAFEIVRQGDSEGTITAIAHQLMQVPDFTSRDRVVKLSGMSFDLRLVIARDVMRDHMYDQYDKPTVAVRRSTIVRSLFGLLVELNNYFPKA